MKYLVIADYFGGWKGSFDYERIEQAESRKHRMMLMPQIKSVTVLVRQGVAYVPIKRPIVAVA